VSRQIRKLAICGPQAIGRLGGQHQGANLGGAMALGSLTKLLDDEDKI